MDTQFLRLLSVFAFAILPCSPLAAVQHDHGSHGQHGQDASDEPVERPQVFLDKSPRVVAFQLKRLDNRLLLLVETKTDDPKYLPVFEAILTRDGMSRQYREESLHGIMMINESDGVSELLRLMKGMTGANKASESVAQALTSILLDQPGDQIVASIDALKEGMTSSSEYLRVASIAGLMLAGESDAAWEAAESSEQGQLDFLHAIARIPQAAIRSSMRDLIVELIADGDSPAIRNAAIETIETIPNAQDETFTLVAPLFTDAALRQSAVKTLLSIPTEDRDPQLSLKLVSQLVDLAEATPAENRTSDDFVDAMELADQLLVSAPVDEAKAFRDRLRLVTVRVIRIRTVEEEMRYDIPYFAVEAGRPVQVLLENEDLMPHNLVITENGALREVAELGGAQGPEGGLDGKQYVPDSSKVLFATNMVQSRQSERLTFTAPSEPGEYPYVCTFPGHWMRMYGVMVVVDDLDAWVKNPVKPVDPVGNTRSFVKNWTVDDIVPEMEAGLQARTKLIGQQVFKDATCAQCHEMGEEGGAIGPDLSDVVERFKNDRAAIVREIVDPSHRIEPKYVMQTVVTVEGRVISGIVTEETDDEITMIENPESAAPIVIAQDDIEDMIESNKSMMPKALLDQFTQDEIYELLAYLFNEST